MTSINANINTKKQVGYFQFRTVDSERYDVFEIIPHEKYMFSINDTPYLIHTNIPTKKGWAGFIADKQATTNTSWLFYLSSSIFFNEFIEDIEPFIDEAQNTCCRLFWNETGDFVASASSTLLTNTKVELPPQYLSKLKERKEYGKLFI